MIRLLRANFARLFKSWYFRLGVLISVGLNIYADVSGYIAMQAHPELYSMDDVDLSDFHDPEGIMEYLRRINSHESFMFNGALFCMFIVPVLIALFIGTDYSDGTIRNKLMIGHKRCNIYLANLITSVSAAEIMLLSGMAASYIFGLIFFKYTCLSAAEILKFIIVGMFITVSMSAICTFLAMLIPSKAGGTAAAIMTSFVMMISAGSIQSALEVPRYYAENTYSNTKTGAVYELDVPLEEMTPEELEENGIFASDIDNLEPLDSENPYYVKGIKRKIYIWIQKATPGCQFISLSEWEKKFNDSSLAWSSVFTLVTTAAGILVFRKRNLK